MSSPSSVSSKLLKTNAGFPLARCMQLFQMTMTRRWNMQTKTADWRALSEAASQEQDPQKLMELVEELNAALLHREVEMRRRLAIN